MRSKKDESAMTNKLSTNKDSQDMSNSYIEESLTIKHILVGKAAFLVTFFFFMWKVPGYLYVDFFAYTIFALAIVGFITRRGWISTTTNFYLIYGLTGYASALWILGMTQAVGN